MSEKYVDTFIEALEANRQKFEDEKSVYENMKALVSNDLRTIEDGIRPITEYISSHYSEIAYVRQVADYTQLNVNYKAHHVVGFSFNYDKNAGVYTLDITGDALLQKLIVTKDNDTVRYEADGNTVTLPEIIERYVKYTAEYVASDQYRID